MNSTSLWNAWTGVLIVALVFATFVASMILRVTDIADSIVKPTSTPIPPVTAMPSALPVRVFQALAGAVSVTVSQDGTMLATVSGETFDWANEIRLWKVATGELICVIRTQEPSNREPNQIHDVAFAPGSNILASGHYGQVKLWRTSDGTLLHTLQSSKESRTAVAFSPDGSTLVSSAGHDEPFILWKVSDGSLVRTLPIFEPARDMAISPDGTVLAAGFGSLEIKLWQIADGKLLHTFYTGWGDSQIVFSPDEMSLLTASSTEGEVILRRIKEGTLLSRLGAGSRVRAVAFSPAGIPLVVEPDGQTIQIKRAYDGALLGVLEGQDSPPVNLALSPDGTILASGGNDGRVRIWHVFASHQKAP